MGNILLFEQFEETEQVETKREAFEDLDRRYHGHLQMRLSRAPNYDVIVYHGTSQRAANAIEATDLFKDGFFMGTTRFHEYIGSVGQYAKNRALEAGEKDKGVVPRLLVDPRCLTVNGAGELESYGDLTRNASTNVWENEELRASSELTSLDPDVPPALAQELGFAPGSPQLRVAYFTLSILRIGFNQEQLRNLRDLQTYYRRELTAFLELTPRRLSNRAKDFGVTRDELVEAVEQLLTVPVEKFLA